MWAVNTPKVTAEKNDLTGARAAMTMADIGASLLGSVWEPLTTTGRVDRRHARAVFRTPSLPSMSQRLCLEGRHANSRGEWFVAANEAGTDE
jgi:hypothetical protein